MKRARDKICREQGFRQSRKFPKDRIAFYRGTQAVVADTKAFSQWFEKEITLDELRSVVAKNNYLDEYFPDGMIPEAMMLNELRHTGWLKEGRKHESEVYLS